MRWQCCETHCRNKSLSMGKKNVSYMADSKFSLLFLSWSSLFYPPLPFVFLLSSILCSFFQVIFLSLYSLCLCIPIFLAWIFLFFFFLFPHIITHPSDMSQYCMEVHCKHILVPCCYIFNPSKLTFLYHSFSAQKETKLRYFWFLYVSLLENHSPKMERGRRWGTEDTILILKKKKPKL